MRGSQHGTSALARTTPNDFVFGTREGFLQQSSRDRASRHIRQLIFDGALPAGTHVPQDDIAAELGLSRIPIREALISLERQGWVRIERHRGAFVSGLDPQTVHDHYELYGLIFGFAARQALEREPEPLAARLRDLVALLPDAADDPIRFGELARSFHASVVQASRSSRVEITLQSLSALVPGEFFSHVPASIEIERAAMMRIEQAVGRDDPDDASAAYVDMMRPIGALVVDVFRERGLFDDRST